MVSLDASEQDVARAFAGIESVKIVRNHESGQSKGTGFLTFRSFEAAETAFNGRKEAEINGQAIWLDFLGPWSRKKLSKKKNSRGASRGRENKSKAFEF